MMTKPALLDGPSTTTIHKPSIKLASILKGLIIVLLTALLVYYTSLFLWRSFTVLSYHYPVSYGEGSVMSEAARLAIGKSIYTDSLTPPYMATNYGPLGYLSDALTLIWASAPSLFGGRLLTFLGCLVAIICIYFIAAIRVNRLMAVAAALTTVSTEPIFSNSSLYKFDMQAVALSLTAALFISLIETKNEREVTAGFWQGDRYYSQWRLRLNRWSPYLAGVLCACAFLTKQSALAAPIAIFIFLAINAPAKALRFAVTLATTVVLVIVVLQLATHGAFWQHFVVYNEQSYSLARLSDWLVYLIQRYSILFGLSIAYIVARFLTTKGFKQKIDLWSLYWLLAVGISCSSGKVGANLNYYIEVMFLSCLLAWWAINAIWQSRSKFKMGNLQVSFTIVGLFLIVVQLAIVCLTPFDIHFNTPTEAAKTQAQQIEATIQQYAAQGPILVEDSGWLLSWNSLNMSGMDDPFAFKQLYDLGRWNQNSFLEDLRNGRYKYVMLQMWGVKDTDTNLDKQVADHNYSPQPDRFTLEEQKYFRKLFTPVKRIGLNVFLKWNG